MKVLLVSEGVHEEAGALEAFVRCVAPRIQSCTWDCSSRNDIVTRKGKGQGFFKRAVRWMLHARKQGFDALVLVIDQDRRRESSRELDEAQNEITQTGKFPRALGIAIRSFDAWILADEKALTSVLGYDVNRPKSPEDDRNPKKTCAKLLEKCTVNMRPRDFYAEVAKRADPQCLCERCPKGFGVFAARLQSLSPAA